jgi:hypothetical protein
VQTTKKIVACFLLIAFAFHVSKHSLFLSLKAYAPDTFTELFCENKTNDSKQVFKAPCNGHCKVEKMTKEQSHDDSSIPQLDLSKEFQLFHQLPLDFTTQFEAFILPTEHACFSWLNFYHFHYSLVNLKPPIEVNA